MIDKITIRVRGGKGGDGSVSFRREKFVPFGGPDGGRGGNGGSAYLKVDGGMSTFASYRSRSFFKAEDGQHGSGRDKSGRGGQDLYLPVPKGTFVFQGKGKGRDKLVKALLEEREELLLAGGGRGGRGNASFANSREQAPRIAEAGEPGEEGEFTLELKLLADVAIIGYPSSGKSTLLSRATAARPKIGAYPFTTLEPVLGVVETDSYRYSMAEIPGLIKGAHKGVGLGDEFLRHAQRSRVLLHLLDGEDEAPEERFNEISQELELFDSNFLAKPQLIAVNKIDLPEVREKATVVKEALEGHGCPLYFVSANTGEGVGELLRSLGILLKDLPIEEAPQPAVSAEPRLVKQEVRVYREGETFVVQAPAAERLLKMTDIDHMQARHQLMKRLERMGVHATLEKAGVKAGDTVRIGTAEFVWQ